MAAQFDADRIDLRVDHTTEVTIPEPPSHTMLSTLSMAIGRETVEEPKYEVIWKHTEGVEYEIRRYGERFAAETHYDDDKTDQPFMRLARYIGVFGTPENEGQETIAMTVPVVKKDPTKIAMTAPVVESIGEDGEKVMDFMLQAEYDSYDKIPRPTNPQVQIREIPPAVGVVHRYSGSQSTEKASEMATELALELQKNGLDLDVNDVLESYQYWGYNPPFTLPMLRRNEVWVELTEDQVEQLVNGYDADQMN